MIEINGLEKKFGKKTVLKNVSLKIDKGTVYGLIGKNGAGKTTLINIIAGLSDASAGECFIDGELIKRGLKTKVKIGYLPDLPAFFEHMTAGEYLDFLLKDLRPLERLKKKKELLTLVKLENQIKIKTMSRGMRQRLGIAATLVNDPNIIILDEPTSALDPLGRSDLIQIIKELKQNDKTIILSTHILTDMEKVCDKVGFLHNGIIKKSMLIGELEKQEMTVNIRFDGEVNVKPYDNSRLDIIQKSEDEYVFRTYEDRAISNQKYMFEYLSSLDTKICGMKKELQSLDDLFQEVCQ